ncbi:uncharacterized protein A4U43_C10F5930 [Asparagus officinalis]|uniref:Aminotransferase class I/classII large domain-containing protein n=1 Tax=Asparagus officinalis TaxID=4686 RepID=A0A5P1E5H0_ASPOF|nr:uncharacterized protein A4U43_C10F5930 [Asparagus officinalis]
MVDFMGRIMGGSVTFNPSQIILTGGASAAIEALGFCLADPGNAFLVPSPYYPGVGAIYSYNENVLAAASKFAKFYSISVPTQQLLVSMLTDTKFITEYIEVNRERILKIYTSFVDGLKQLGVDCVNSSGGFYCWADMCKFIWPYSEKGELELWDKLLNVAKINVTPGSSCHCIEPGWFRCCFATLAESDIPVVMERIKTVIEG